MTQPAALSARDVRKRFGAVLALDRVSLDVARGECVALIGESGSGKTTLLRCFNRLSDPDDGQVLVDGEDVGRLDPVALRRRIGYVPQEGGLLPHWRVRRNVTLVPWLLGAAGRAANAPTARSASSGSSPRRSATAGRASSPAASGSGWRWRARSPPARTSSCSTSRSARSTRSPGPTCRPPSSGSRRELGLTSLLVTHDSPRRCCWPTGSRSCARAGSSRSPRPPSCVRHPATPVRRAGCCARARVVA